MLKQKYELDKCKIVRKILSILILISIVSCKASKPIFNKEKEEKRIKYFIKNSFTDKEFLLKQMDVFFPKEYWKHNNKIEFSMTMDSTWNNLIKPVYFNNSIQNNHEVQLNKVSNQIKIRGRYFIIININETFDIIKPLNIEGIDNFEKYMKRNLIPYKEDNFKLIVNSNNDVLGIFDKNSNNWYYFNLSENAILSAYGIKDTKKIISLYFNEIFEYSKENWDEDLVKEIKEIYSETKDYNQYKYLNFDDYCNCKIEYDKKLPDDVPNEYYDQSEAILKSIYRCRIFSTNLKKYEKKKLH